MSESFLNDRVRLHCGDCLEVLAAMPENSLDAAVTDPPYHLVSIVKRFGSPTAKPVRVGDINATNDLKAAHARAAAGFMGKLWDGGDIAFDPDTWRAVYRVLKPGAHLLAMGGTRTYHRLACAIEDAGFEIRDCIQWLYGSGFPKSHDVSKGIDRAAGAVRDATPTLEMQRKSDIGEISSNRRCAICGKARISADPCICPRDSGPATDAARQWEGWGTALKPACELIVLARKPLSEGTFAANVLKWGTGAINVGACRIGVGKFVPGGGKSKRGNQGGGIYGDGEAEQNAQPHSNGRWPANVIHDGSEEVVAAFPDEAGSVVKFEQYSNHFAPINPNMVGWTGKTVAPSSYGDSGSAARFFYTAKADADDRIGSKHPTIKPLDLMQYLVRLICPKAGTVLDLFAGTGTTGEAAWREGFSAVLIEREQEYCADIRRRMALALSGPDERVRESIKARNLPRDDGPLFSGIPEAAE
jgi:site-specific DNA-methyltransferase (adenine-specific)